MARILGAASRPRDARAALAGVAAHGASSRYGIPLAERGRRVSRRLARRSVSRNRVYSMAIRFRTLVILFAVALPGAEAGAHMAPHARVDALTLDLARRPDDWRLWIERAQAYLEDGHPTAALSDLDRAEALAPRRPEVPLERGAALLALGLATPADDELTERNRPVVESFDRGRQNQSTRRELLLLIPWNFKRVMKDSGLAADIAGLSFLAGIVRLRFPRHLP